MNKFTKIYVTFYALSLVILGAGITCICIGVSELSREVKKNDELKSSTCVVIYSSMNISPGSDEYERFLCGIVTINGMVCGVDRIVRFETSIEDKIELNKSYTIGSDLPCWIDQASCTILKERYKINIWWPCCGILVGVCYVLFVLTLPKWYNSCFSTVVNPTRFNYNPFLFRGTLI